MSWRLIYTRHGNPMPLHRDGFATEAEAEAWAEERGFEDYEPVEVP